MVDPVVASDGCMYKRSAIEQLFSEVRDGEEPRSPMTGHAFANRNLIPNAMVRQAAAKSST